MGVGNSYTCNFHLHRHCIQTAVDIFRYNLYDDETPMSAESAKPHLPGQCEHECKPAIA